MLTFPWLHLVLPAAVLFVHPVYNFVVLRYQPQELVASTTGRAATPYASASSVWWVVPAACTLAGACA